MKKGIKNIHESVYEKKIKIIKLQKNVQCTCIKMYVEDRSV